jgi:hypothetical protein
MQQPINNNKQQTAVEWLVEQMIYKLGIRIENTTDGCELFEQAKEMEKEQIINAFDGFPLIARNSQNGEEYYNETYNN